MDDRITEYRKKSYKGGLLLLNIMTPIIFIWFLLSKKVIWYWCIIDCVIAYIGMRGIIKMANGISHKFVDTMMPIEKEANGE